MEHKRFDRFDRFIAAKINNKKERSDNIVDFGKVVAIWLNIIPALLYALLFLILKYLFPCDGPISELLPAIFLGAIGLLYYLVRGWLRAHWANGDFLNPTTIYVTSILSFVGVGIFLYCNGLERESMNMLAVLISSFFGIYGPSEEIRSLGAELKKSKKKSEPAIDITMDSEECDTDTTVTYDAPPPAL